MEDAGSDVKTLEEETVMEETIEANTTEEKTAKEGLYTMKRQVR